MDNTFQKIPFLRITLAFAGGIALAATLPLQLLPYLLFAGLCIGILFILQRNYTYKNEAWFGTIVWLLFMSLGASLFMHYNRVNTAPTPKYMLATLLEKPQEKPNSYKSLLEIHAYPAQQQLIHRSKKAIVYFQKSDNVKELLPGSELVINAKLQEVQNFGNPYSFDHKRYLNNKGIHYQLYVNSSSWKPTKRRSHSLKIYAELIREKLLTIYRSQQLGKNETEILSALTLGYKRGLDPETKRIFAAAGAMHILAVSGLHVGIIYLLINYLLGFLKKKKAGALIFSLSAILLLWTFAFITGLSPSVLRAATMFSILIVGENVQRKANIYNSLAASALFLLLFNPNNLFEVGFQLSYSAVFGIVFLQPKLAGLMLVKNKFYKFFWNLFCVSLAAQIATFPLAAYYFHQFPLYFALSNFIVIPAASLLIPLGIALLVFASIPYLGAVLAFGLKWIIKLVYFSLQWIEELPYAVVHNAINEVELLFLVASVLFGFLFISKRNARTLQLTLLSSLFFVLSMVHTNFQQQQSRELLVFKHSSKAIVLLISGRANYVIGLNPAADNGYLLRQLSEIKHKKRLNQTIFLDSASHYQDELLFVRQGIIQFEGKTILLEQSNGNYTTIPAHLYITPKNIGAKHLVHKSKKTISLGYVKQALSSKQWHSLAQSGTYHEMW